MTPSCPSNTRRPGFHFSQGQLCITTAQDEMRLGTWPLLEATRQRQGTTEWQRFVPAFRLLRPKADMLAIEVGPEGLRSAAIDPLLEKHQAFRLFRQAIPPRIAAAAERFSSRQWAVLRMVQEREEALDIVEQNSALGFCVANLGKFRTLFGNLGRQAGELSRRPQREILAWLGFPDSQAWVNVFGKILPETITVERALALRKVSKDTELIKRLAHVTSINTGLLAIAVRPRLLADLSPALLNEVAASEAERLQASALRLLEDILEAWRYMDQRPRLGGIKTLAALHQRSLEANEDVQRYVEMQQKRFLFPAPPFPGTADIIPLTDGKELLEEGRQQRNCVGGYGERVARGEVFIYRILAPERATLAIEPSAGGGYEIQQLKRACNQPVAQATLQSVQRWLAGESVSL